MGEIVGPDGQPASQTGLERVREVMFLQAKGAFTSAVNMLGEGWTRHSDAVTGRDKVETIFKAFMRVAMDLATANIEQAGPVPSDWRRQGGLAEAAAKMVAEALEKVLSEENKTRAWSVRVGDELA